MIIDANRFESAPLADPEVLIVGSGPVGLTLARALDDRGMRVLILESGPRETAVPRTDTCDVLQDGTVLDSVASARTRQVGGGLNLWGGQLGLMEPSDVDYTKGWPLRYAELYRHLDEVLSMIGLRGRHVGERLKASYGPQSVITESSGTNLRLTETAWLPRPKFDRQFWKWLNRSHSCHLWHDATCIGFEGGATSAPKARVVIGNTHRRAILIEARKVVLAAGTIENARLLMLQSSSCKEPWHGNRWLGRGFNDHLDASAGRVAVIDRKRLAQVFDPYLRKGVKYVPKIVWESRTATSTGLGACGLPSYSLTNGQALQDMSILVKNLIHQPSARNIARLPTAVLNSARNMAPLIARYMASRRIGRLGSSEVAFRISVEQRARWQSSLRLSTQELDRDGLPRCILSWQRGDEELHSMGEFADAVDQWLYKSGIGRLEIEESLARRSPKFWDQVNSGLHHAGTTRMARNDEDGVVDSQLRVFGSSALFVCGASVFPSSGYINPTLTAMALAARLADHLASTWTAK